MPYSAAAAVPPIYAAPRLLPMSTLSISGAGADTGSEDVERSKRCKEKKELDHVPVPSAASPIIERCS